MRCVVPFCATFLLEVMHCDDTSTLKTFNMLCHLHGYSWCLSRRLNPQINRK